MMIDGTDLGLVRIQGCPCHLHKARAIPRRMPSISQQIQSAKSLPLPPARVVLVNGSPILTINGYPYMWLETWIRNRERRHGV